MERPASDEAIEAYNRQLRERYGDAVVYAALNLAANPDDIWALRYQLDGVEMVQPVEISPRHETIIAQFGHTIIAMLEKDPDGFWSDIQSPQDRPYPSRWA